MNINELRIGNYVLESNDGVDFNIIKVDKISAIDNNIVGDNEDNLYSLDAISPIVLTEDILLKCGITKQNGYPYKYLDGYIKIRNGVYFFKYYKLEVELPYLHTFQNLHKSLTQQELNIQL